jgi:chromosome segregation ATPase
MTEFLSYSEFAVLVGKSERTIQRYIRSQKIECESTPDGIRIHRDEALKLVTTDVGQGQDDVSDSVGQVVSRVGHAENLSDKVSDNLSLAVATAYKALERSEKLEAQLAETEKRRLGLEFELNRYRCVLSENAESLAEERARRLQFECLEAENAKAREQWEAERAELVEKLKLSENRISWMEQRVPRWVRSLFKAV